MECWLHNSCNHVDCDKDYCMRKDKLDYLYKMSLLSESQKNEITLELDKGDVDVDEFKRLGDIKEGIVSFVKNGQNLYIHSPNCGNGKTTWAIKMIQAYFNAIWPKTSLRCRALFVSTPRFLSAMKENISVRNEYYNYVKENIYDADLVVFDDIASKIGTEFELNNLFSIIDYRVSTGKSTIYTSNMSNINDLQATIGARLASRVCLSSEEIVLKGPDRRRFVIKNGGNK